MDGSEFSAVGGPWWNIFCHPAPGGWFWVFSVQLGPLTIRNVNSLVNLTVWVHFCGHSLFLGMTSSGEFLQASAHRGWLGILGRWRPLWNTFSHPTPGDVNGYSRPTEGASDYLF